MYEKVFLKYQANAKFLSMCLPSGNAFLSYVYFKKKKKAQEKMTVSKKITFLLKTNYKVFINTRPMQGFLRCLCPPGMPFSAAEGGEKSL